MRRALMSCTAVLFLCAAPALAAPDLAKLIAAGERSAENRARDVYRHPKETLEFFGLKAQQTVVEVWPGKGWYTEILAPYLRERGRYVAAGFAVGQEATPQWRIDMTREFGAKLAATPKIYDRVVVAEIGPENAWHPVPAGSADLVLTFRNVHNWMNADYEARMFQAFFEALKPGGTLGVVEHRARPETDREGMKRSGYVTEAYVIQLAEKAGFKLADRSEINANPKDDTDHPKGVWTLPPTLRLGDEDRDKYLAIGESDRMTLKFTKRGN